MSRGLKLLVILYAILFVSTGILMILVANTTDSSPAWLKLLNENNGLIFVWHLGCWMVAGMVANYYWDLFNQGKGFSDIQIPRLLLPLLVAPIVLYPTYNLWLTSKSASYILFELIAFQNGFFWQALFSKARPIES
jgi:hypothetical protein